MTAINITIMVVFAIAVIILPFYISSIDRKRVMRHFEESGNTILSIKRSFPMRAFISARNTTFWVVHYRTADGQKKIAKCFSSFLRVKIYEDDADEK